VTPLQTRSLARHLRSCSLSRSADVAVSALSGGQSNPTYLVDDGTQRFVLRKKPPGALLASAHAIDREYRVMSALEGSDVPVPRMLGYCDDTSIVGTPFYLMEFLVGRVLMDPSLPGMQPDERGAVYREMNRVVAALHRIDFRTKGLGDYGKPGRYVARQIDRWSHQCRESVLAVPPALGQLMAWLPQNVPADEETTLVHGDYRLDNLVFHPTEPRVIGVLDWELSTLGHPLADFSYHCMSWHIVPAGGHGARGIGGLDHAALGIPSERDYVRRYCERTGRGNPDAVMADWNFYLAYNLFRAAGIAQGIMKRVQDGTAASLHAVEAGKKARPMAESGWEFAKRV